jgi:hypothetical protein
MKWFQVDSDTPHDPKMRAVLRELGAAGFGGLVLLWCHIADHGTRRPGFSIDSQGKPMPIPDLVDATRLTLDQFDRLVAVCLETGHFMLGPWQAKKVIAIPAMARRADFYTQRKISGGVARQQYGKSGMTRLEIFERDSYICAYCRKQKKAERLEVDHIVPKFRGGTDDPKNLTTACKSCNRKKGTELLDEKGRRIQSTIALQSSTPTANKTVQDTTVQGKRIKAAAAPPASPVDYLKEADRNVGVLTKIAHTVIEEIGPQHPDLTESVKSEAARQRIAYSGRVVAKALESALWQRVHGRTGT